MSHDTSSDTALITGAASGIGFETARVLARRGIRVAMFDRDIDRLAGAVDAVIAEGGEAVELHGDVSSAKDVQSAVRSAVDTFGRLNIAVANAGIDVVGLVHELDEEDWARGLAVNLTGVFLVAKYTMPELIKSGGGSFLAVASAAGVKALANNAAYVAAKHGVVGLVRTLAVDYGGMGIRSNVVCPGFIETPMVRAYFEQAPEGERARRLAKIAAGRFGAPQEIAAAIAHLTSEDAQYVNGIVHVVDGGAYAGYVLDERGTG